MSGTLLRRRSSEADRDTDRRILRLAVPALGSLAVEPVYVLVDTAIVGRLGTAQLAGLAVAATVLSFVFAGANFLTYGTTERVARRLGAGDDVAAAEVAVQAMWIAVLVGTPAALLLGFSAR
ncbi:MAG: MATE family efflux transporter, partial [Ilumatobacteraceae bacterium]